MAYETYLSSDPLLRLVVLSLLPVCISVIGSVVLSLGFYTVIWGKAREDASKPVTSSEHYSPLLLARTVDDES
ncbi:hypothetical protein F2Q68_00035666 [Brassica cretica]|uniref:Uncharacterized protein n=1 Tax=Brassica cretica TaxID=69181 RepID=A0A8S9H8S5_BRACR|nr:hypothetical protein F2Q68_00035666 [Brassica cretica]